MPTDGDSAAIVKAIIGLGISLGISTTAEGVETEEQLNRLRAEGCTDIQGYLLSKPVPAAEVAAVLNRSINPENLYRSLVPCLNRFIVSSISAVTQCLEPTTKSSKAFIRS